MLVYQRVYNVGKTIIHHTHLATVKKKPIYGGLGGGLLLF